LDEDADADEDADEDAVGAEDEDEAIPLLDGAPEDEDEDGAEDEDEDEDEDEALDVGATWPAALLQSTCARNLQPSYQQGSSLYLTIDGLSRYKHPRCPHPPSSTAFFISA
jgi:hypothetical protein